MKDIVKDSMSKKEYQPIAKKIVWVGIIASIMMYAGFTSAVMVSKMDKFWVDINLPIAFVYSSIIITVSSLTLYLALHFAKKDKQTLVITFLGLTVLLGLGFSYSQVKGWSQLLGQGNYIADKIFFDYGAYGNQYTILKNGEEIYHDGNHYSLNGEQLSVSDVESLRAFTYQICGDRGRVNMMPYKMKDYGSPYQLKNVKSDEIIDFIDGTAFIGEDSLTVSQRDELFKFSFGVYTKKPFFILQGEYGKDFAINLNGERLDFDDRKLYFPKRDLTDDEIYAIKKTVFQGGKEFVIRKGKVFQNDKEIEMANFETYFDLNKGIQIHLLNGEWTQLRQELNTIQYGEFYQTGNVASSYVWILTFIHFLHLLIGIIVLIVLFVRALKGIYDKESQMGLVVGGIFWHFLGALWLYLFVFLQYNH